MNSVWGSIIGLILIIISLISFLCYCIGWQRATDATILLYCKKEYSQQLKKNKGSYVKWNGDKCLYYKLEK